MSAKRASFLNSTPKAQSGEVSDLRQSRGLPFELIDPFTGTQELRSAVRADGKTLNVANAWLSRKQDRVTHQWSYFVNTFDVNNAAGLSYTLQFEPCHGQTNRPPVLDPIPNRLALVGTYMNFAITAADPDGNAVQFNLQGVTPPGAALDSNSGVFTWRPSIAQVGRNQFRVTATDNGQPPLSASRSFVVTCIASTNSLSLNKIFSFTPVGEGRDLLFFALPDQAPSDARRTRHMVLPHPVSTAAVSCICYLAAPASAGHGAQA